MATEHPRLKRDVKLGVNIFDLDSLNPFVRSMLLGGKVDTTRTVRVDKTRPDEQAVVFTCDTLTAALTIDLIRNEGRHEGQVYRAYILRDKVWVRLANNTVLTVKDGTTFTLDPKVFPVVEEAGLLVAPKIEPVLIRKRK